MKASHRLFSLPYVSLIPLFLLCTVDAHGTCDYESSTCCIEKYIDKLYRAWTAKSLPCEISSSCQKEIFLEWAYELRGALKGKTTMERHGQLDVGIQQLKAKCKQYKRRRSNRSTSNFFTDVFELLSKLSKVLRQRVNWCPLIIGNHNKNYFEQTLALVTKMNYLVRQRNKLSSKRGQPIHGASFGLGSMIVIATPQNIQWMRNWPIGYGR